MLFRAMSKAHVSAIGLLSPGASFVPWVHSALLMGELGPVQITYR